MQVNDSVWKLAASGLIALSVVLLSADRLLAQAGKKSEPSAERREPQSSTPVAVEVGGQAGAGQVRVPTKNVVEMMARGGPVMFVLAVCSIVGLAFMFERLVALRRSRVIPGPFVTRFLQQMREGDLDRERAIAICEDNPSSIAAVFSGAVRKWGRPGVEVEQAVIDAGERASYGLRRYLRVFTGLAVVGPLLGLLGTVIGMIHAFNAVAEKAAGGVAVSDLLAKGISEALLNTAFGLVIAIPAQSLYFYFVGRVDRMVIDMDALGQELVHMVSAEELQLRGDGAGKARRPPKREPTV
jgi:biopolymer transport protein ExbB